MINSYPSKKRVLFVGEEVTLSHIVRLLPLAAALDTDHYTVLFACGTRYRDLVEGAGLRWHFLPSISPKTFARRLYFSLPLYTIAELRRYVRAEQALFRDWQPDIVVSDFRHSLGVSTRNMNIPHITITDAHWDSYSTQKMPLAEGFLTEIFGHHLTHFLHPRLLPFFLARHFAPLKRLYIEAGLTPPQSFRHALTPGRVTLYPDIPSLAPTKNPPIQHRYIGPLFWEPSLSVPAWFTKLPPTLPLVYVSMGSSGNLRVLKKIINVLSRMPVAVLLSTADRFSPKDLPKNIYALPYVSTAQILPRAVLVICHGGSSVAYQAFRFGVPVLGLPTNTAQCFTMEKIVDTQSGLLINPSLATEANLNRAITKLLNEESYRTAAKKIQTEMAHFDAPKSFLATLEELLNVGN